mgnify:CR=1 FL=1
MEPIDAIAVDGPGASGKSVCASVAHILGYRLLDSGALYRAATYCVTLLNLDPTNAKDAETALAIHMPHIGFEGNAVTLHGRVLGEKIRTREIDRLVHHVSEHPRVRDLVVQIQRKFAHRERVVAEGRDMTSVVFRDARVKVFLTADPETRALRRWKQYKENDSAFTGSVGQVMEDLRERDHRDMTRTHSPLVQVPDAVVIDSTRMSREEVVEQILGLCRPKTPVDSEVLV